MDFRHAPEGLDDTADPCGAAGRGGKLSVDCLTGCCDSCDSEGGSNGLVSGSEPSGPPNVLAPFFKKKELPTLRKELPNLLRLGLAAMIVLTVGDGTALIMSIDCLHVQRNIYNKNLIKIGCRL